LLADLLLTLVLLLVGVLVVFVLLLSTSIGSAWRASISNAQYETYDVRAARLHWTASR
jgi:branched-subunit amino acid ABC-type transport system permease component